MNFIKLPKKWSGQNQTSRTGSYAYVFVSKWHISLVKYMVLDYTVYTIILISLKAIHTVYSEEGYKYMVSHMKLQ